MTIDEAIRHAEKVGKDMRNIDESELDLIYCGDTDCIEEHKNRCVKCANEHEQLAEWLKDYKRLKEQEPKTGHWIETGNIGHIDIDNVILYQEMCDKCKGLSYFRRSADKLIGARNCPNCGAKMESEVEE